MTSRADVKAMDHAADMLTYNTRKSSNVDASMKTERGKNSRAGAQAASPSLGPILRERREAMGVTLAEAEVATRIRQKYLAALESDEWDLLPGEVVGRGFLRNYSTYLGIEPTEMIERRRAVADESLAAVLADTSAGTPLPPDRPVDYRPKDVALHDETEELEAPRQLNLMPAVIVLAVVAVAFGIWWAVTQFGDVIGDGFASIQEQVVALQQPPAAATEVQQIVDTPTLPDNLIAPPAVVESSGAESSPSVALDTAPATPAEAVQPVVEVVPTPQPAQPAAEPVAAQKVDLLTLLPTPTPQPVIPTAPPAAAPSTVITAANLRQGPSTDFPVVGAATEGEVLTITGRTADSTWYQLENQAWIFAQLVNNPPTDLPVVEAPTTP